MCIAIDRYPNLPCLPRFPMLDTAGELLILIKAIKEHGSVNAAGQASVSYGVLFDKTANTRTALLSAGPD